MHWEKIDMSLVNSFIRRQRNLGIEANWIKATQTLVGYEKNGAVRFKVRLPYYYDFDVISEKFVELPIYNITVVLVKAGTASVGFFENGHLSSHKVFRSYMVRKKQGKSQIKYLKTKGKSRAGSRVRLQQTLEFFQNINSRLNEIDEANHLERIAISCSKTLWPYLFGEDARPPITKDDNRLLRVPIHIPNATHKFLIKTHEHLLTCRIFASDDVLADFYKNDSIQTDGNEENLEDW